MDLLGTYNSNLQAFTYQQLLAVYQSQITQGGFAGNQSFDTSIINNLIAQSEEFTQLPVPEAGDRSTDDSLNNPLNLLAARYNALVLETQDYVTQTNSLIDTLQKDTALLDDLLAGVDLNAWVAAQPVLTGAQQFSWDYGMGPGPSSGDITKVDPSNGVTYAAECPTDTYLSAVDSSQFSGMAAPSTDVTIEAKNLAWTWTPMTPGEQSQTLYGDGWAELDLLEDYPILNFLPNPSVNVLLPTGGSIAGVFNIAGTVAGGSIPIFVQTVFQPRRNSLVLTPQNALSDGGFELGGSTWTFGDGWALYQDSDAQAGFYDARKGAFSAWNASINYSPGNVVVFLGFEWHCILTGNAGVEPNLPANPYWVRAFPLSSQTFPLRSLDKVYVEAWIKSLNADGIVNIALSCLDHDGNLLQPQVFMPGVSSADNWLELTDVLQAIDNSQVAFGRLDITVFNQTQGLWKVDSFRVHLPQNLSAYAVNQDDAAVYIPLPDGTPGTVYLIDTDFIIDDVSDVIFEGLPDGVPVTVRFTESFPAYQCSVNGTVWSPLVMLDPNRPYPDNTTQFYPINIGTGGLFPITDELGVPTGLTLQVIGTKVPFQYYFEVTTQATPQYGATAQLEIDLSRPTYMNALTLAPFTNYPVRLQRVDTQAFGTDTRQTVGLPNVLLDRPVILTFPTTLLQTVYLTLYQENYNLSTYQVQPPDALRRDVLFTLQNNLPFNVRRPQRAVPVFRTGAQYSFGLETIAGVTQTPKLPGVFIAGPSHFQGCPELIRLDMEFVDEGSIPNFNVYLCWKAYSASDALLDEQTTGILFAPGTCEVFPFTNPSTLDSGNVDHVDIYLKFVFRDAETVLERYLLQVTSV